MPPPDNLEAKINNLNTEVLIHKSKTKQLKYHFDESQKLSLIGSWTWDLASNKVEWSDMMFIILGLSPQSVSPDYELALNHVHEKDKEAYEVQLKKALDNKESYFFKNRVRKKDNSIISVISRGNCVCNEQGELIKMIGTVQDVTEKNKLLEDNINLEHFAQVLSHDFKTPVRNIISLIGLLKKTIGTKINEKENRYFKLITNSANDLYALLEDILKKSKIDAEILSYSNIPAKAFLETIIYSIESEAKFNSIDIVIEEMPSYIYGDRIKLRRVFQNIILNAIKFSQESHNASISIKHIDDNTHNIFCIADNGIGIEQSQQENIFKSFYQTNRKNKSEGNGLGLFICNHIIELHDGKIWLESELNKGSNFYFSIPKNK